MVPGLDWYYNSRTGYVVELPVLVGQANLHSGIGWHGPFDSKQQALDYYNRNQAANPGWKPPTGASGALNNAPDAAKQLAGDAVDKVADLPFHGINLETWFLRIGEILLGLVLIGVGLAKITGASNVISKAMKVIP